MNRLSYGIGIVVPFQYDNGDSTASPISAMVERETVAAGFVGILP